MKPGDDELDKEGLGGMIDVYEAPPTSQEVEAMEAMMKWEAEEKERKRREAEGTSLSSHCTTHSPLINMLSS